MCVVCISKNSTSCTCADGHTSVHYTIRTKTYSAIVTSQARRYKDKSAELGTQWQTHTNTLIQCELRQSTVICLPGLQTICSGKLATKYAFITKVWACVENMPIHAAQFHTVPPFVWHSTHENQEESRINDLCACVCVSRDCYTGCPGVHSIPQTSVPPNRSWLINKQVRWL